MYVEIVLLHENVCIVFDFFLPTSRCYLGFVRQIVFRIFVTNRLYRDSWATYKRYIHRDI